MQRPAQMKVGISTDGFRKTVLEVTTTRSGLGYKRTGNDYILLYRGTGRLWTAALLARAR